MNFRSNLISLGRRAFHLALPVLALSMGVSLMSAAEVYRGTMNLPVPAHWGDAVLAPGPYTISIETIPSGARLINILSDGAKRILLAGPAESEEQSDHGSVTLVNVGGTYVVKRFDAGHLGNSFTFPVPKGLHSEKVTASAAVETSVDVTGSH